MKIAGVVCEYNPFHNGHKYQLDIIRRQFDAVICIMSGSFVQRGDAAVFDKWTRARAALLNGADLVLELPVRYCLSSAQGFARGAVETLDRTGVADALCFGSECADIAALKQASELISDESPEISAKIRSLLSEGLSYPSALAAAYDGILDSALLSSPNDILALEYISAINRIKSSIVPLALSRKAVAHNSQSPAGKFASATAIRKLISDGADISEYVPFDYSGCAKYDINRLTDIFKYILFTQGTGAFDGIYGMEPGLAERFLKYSEKSSLSEIIDAVKTKRYTSTRLCRIVVSAIVGLRGGFCPPEYIRILGTNNTGRKIISQMRTAAKLPIINKAADFSSVMFTEEIRATDIASFCTDGNAKRGRDFTTSPVYINS